MRKPVIASVALHTVAGAAALLWLLWCFIPAGNLVRGLVTVAIVILAAGLVRRTCRHQENQTDGVVSPTNLSLPDTQEPLVLVCGDGLDALFQGQTLRKTAQGCWLRAGNTGELIGLLRGIQAQSPRQTGQLSVMYVCQPDLYPDEAVLRAELKTLRQQIKQMNALTGLTFPVVLSGEFSGPETPWLVVRGDRPVVCPADQTPQALTDWQQSDNHIAVLPVLSQSFSFVREILLDELEKTDKLTPPVRFFAVTVRLGAVNPVLRSVWMNWLYRRTGLRFPHLTASSEPDGRFPDALLPLLAPFASPLQGGRRTRRLVLLLWACALVALGFSARNNHDLIRKTATDLQRWSAIPMNHYAPKAESLAALKQDALRLERWQRQGEPLRYGLGYYQGQRLWLALQQAIDTYVPGPSPKVEPSPVASVESSPKIVRLDSMSLFDSGKAALKNGSTRVLVNALMGIKARPGWLIVVSGHTDNTGSAQRNQILSLQRAEAVRDWMRDTGNVPESCFAVQGYGDSRPVASNDTPDGRARNRRVEISLVPQADACRVPDATTASPDPRDALTQ